MRFRFAIVSCLFCVQQASAADLNTTLVEVFKANCIAATNPLAAVENAAAANGWVKNATHSGPRTASNSKVVIWYAHVLDLRPVEGSPLQILISTNPEPGSTQVDFCSVSARRFDDPWLEGQLAEALEEQLADALKFGRPQKRIYSPQHVWSLWQFEKQSNRAVNYLSQRVSDGVLAMLWIAPDPLAAPDKR